MLAVQNNNNINKQLEIQKQTQTFLRLPWFPWPFGVLPDYRPCKGIYLGVGQRRHQSEIQKENANKYHHLNIHH